MGQRRDTSSGHITKGHDKKEVRKTNVCGAMDHHSTLPSNNSFLYSFSRFSHSLHSIVTLVRKKNYTISFKLPMKFLYYEALLLYLSFGAKLLFKNF